MEAVKVYNNSAVSAVKPDGREVILTGSGIGFSKRPGDTIDERKIEKTYYIQSELQTKFLQLLKDASPDAVRVAEDILEHARAGGLELKDQLLLSLIDHICFAIERYEQGIELPYLMLAETKMLYPREFKIGEWAVRQIEFACKLQGDIPRLVIGQPDSAAEFNLPDCPFPDFKFPGIKHLRSGPATIWKACMKCF